MKKIILLIIIVIALPIAYDKVFPNSSVLQKSPLLSKFKSIEKFEQKQINLDGQTYLYSFFTPSSSQQLIFDLNLSKKQPSVDIIEEQQCQYLINGGFYDKLDQPIGLVIKDGLEISPAQKNRLFNGYISATNSANFNISTSQPSLSSVVAIQTGPLLIKDLVIQNLQLISDQHKRRMVLAIASDNTPYFIVITLEESDAEGPMLGNLPKLINLIGKKEKLTFSDAINLDGGSASTFYTPNIHIKELTTIGSYLCFK